ncbi:hypothetical protein [Winogradskyella vincentii]|uniref:SRPBCC family protein n=1 Tax=Winogradskyella vincentii TaxID=2877122 RepID=A0ABS7Y1R8_9FLAO|nr:hypothetical protein [Winogradskyella vincentii]MCA0153866.1 hypothetical protein [Winogradskyella vincentii]
MRVNNIHKRTINQPKERLSVLIRTLATENDLIWPTRNWPSMRFKEGFKIGAKGGHGIIKYEIIKLKDGESIRFKFIKPEGFIGYHQLHLVGLSEIKTEIVHEIKMRTTFKATFFWLFIIRWLHNALIEEAFDNVENHFSVQQKNPQYNYWVKFLRRAYNRKPTNVKLV